MTARHNGTQRLGFKPGHLLLNGTIGCLMLGAFTQAASAAVVKPNTGLTTVIGDTTLSIYYRPTDAGYEVVTTAGSGSPMKVVRFVSTLTPGQTVEVSVPRPIGQKALGLKLTRSADQVLYTGLEM